MRGPVLGLDLSASPRRPTAAVALGQTLSPHFVGFVTDDGSIYELVRRLEPRLVAVDAPLTLPQGLHCLEESCSCCAPSYPLRSAERELASYGIGCFFTTKASIIKGTVYRGISLAARLRGEGYEVVEVYPFGSKVRLWGDPARQGRGWGIPKKNTRRGTEFLRQRLGELLPGLRPHLSTLNHDLADAAVAAYTGWLHLQHRCQVVGAEDGPIILPAIL